ncbi:hypothetical protein BURPS406E_G0636 [Burkholderia pseudomallei 406e]|nr:hypothetical protein BURPS406E_G0636 [Burkholderia pseudomallei 406e]
MRSEFCTRFPSTAGRAAASRDASAGVPRRNITLIDVKMNCKRALLRIDASIRRSHGRAGRSRHGDRAGRRMIARRFLPRLRAASARPTRARAGDARRRPSRRQRHAATRHPQPAASAAAAALAARRDTP